MKKRIALLALLISAFSTFTQADDSVVLKSLKNLGINNAEIQPSPVAGLQAALTEQGVLYVTNDGKYILQGPMYDVSGKVPNNATNQILKKRLEQLKDQMIVYPAKTEKHVVTVFTDITCGYCRKLHEEMKEYNDLGITVRYLAFPRQGIKSQAEKDMRSIWCTAQRNKAFDAALRGDDISPATCAIDLGKHYELGIQFGVSGTPAMVLSDGMLVPGYQPPKTLFEMLEKHKKAIQ